MTQFLRRLGFVALMTGVAICPLESAIAQSNDKTEPWETEWKLDRMTDTKTFFLTTNVQTEAGHYYQLILRCEPNYIAMVLTAFTQKKEARRIKTDFRNSRGIQIRFDKNRAIGARFEQSEYYNRLEGYLHWGFIEHHPQQLIASKSMLIANVFSDEIFEVKTGFDQATVEACNQSSRRKTKSEIEGERAPANRSEGPDRFVQTCQAKFVGPTEADCQCIGRTAHALLQPTDHDEALKILTIVFTPDADQMQKYRQALKQKDEAFRDRIYQVIAALGKACARK